MIFLLFASRYLRLYSWSRSYFLELVHKFSFYDCLFHFFFVNEFDIHKFVIYYANGHLNYLQRKRFSGLIMMIIFKLSRSGWRKMEWDMQSRMRFHVNKLFCIILVGKRNEMDRWDETMRINFHFHSRIYVSIKEFFIRLLVTFSLDVDLHPHMFVSLSSPRE